MMFSYASAKILGTQFSSDLSIGERTVNSLNGFMLTWYFYGFSKTYGILIALAQIIAAFLLLFRKTVRMGSVLLLSFMVNIVMVDVFYEIDAATPMAILLTVMGLFLLLSDWKAFKAYFLKEELNTNSYKESLPRKLEKVHWFKFMVIPIMLFGMFFALFKLKENFMKKNHFYGVWKVESSIFTHKIDKVYFELNDRIVVIDTMGKMYRGKVKDIDEETNTFNLKAKHYSRSLSNFVKRKIDTSKIKEGKEIKEERSRLTKLYHEVNNSEPIDLSMNYKLSEDTLLLKQNDLEIKLIKAD